MPRKSATTRGLGERTLQNSRNGGYSGSNGPIAEAVTTETVETVDHGWVVCLSGVRLRRANAWARPRAASPVRVLPPAARGPVPAAQASRDWQRRRFKRPKWVPWAWAGLGVLLVAILGAGAVKFLKRHYDTVQDQSINRLLESSRVHEAAARIGEAFVDLDAALDLAQKAGPDWSKRK